MELSYKIPEHLVPYLEFIPEDQLCQMISIALERAINNRSLGGREERKEVMPDYTYLLEEITKRFQTAQVTIPAATAREEIVFEIPTYSFEVVAETSGSGNISDDLDDDFLADITK